MYPITSIGEKCIRHWIERDSLCAFWPLLFSTIGSNRSTPYIEPNSNHAFWRVKTLRISHVACTSQLAPSTGTTTSTMSSSTTPLYNSTKRSGSKSRRPTSRPTTPLRPSSRSSLRESGKSSIIGASDAPLESFEPAFAELSDSMADLEANFMHLQLMHESLARFSESFASFLYGLNMNAFCVDYPEASNERQLLFRI